jgi:hypothetical protein
MGGQAGTREGNMKPTEDDMMFALHEIWRRATDTQMESSRPVLLSILKPLIPAIQEYKETRLIDKLLEGRNG